MEYSNHRMEMIEQMRNKDSINQSRLHASLRNSSYESYNMGREAEESSGLRSLKIRTFLAVIVMVGAFSLKTSSYSTEINRLVAHVKNNPSIEQAVDCFVSEISSYREKK